MKKLNLLLGTLIATAALSHAVDSYSDVVGYNKLSFPTGNSAQAATFVKPSVFTGTATSKTLNSITVSSASFGSLGPVGGLPTHYVKITSGSMNGYVLDILSNTSTSITIDGDLSTAGSTPSFVIRPHVKASDLFRGNTDLSPGSDTMTIYNANGTSTVMLWVGSDSTTGWINPVTEAELDGIIYPGEGFILTTQKSGSFTFQGSVETLPTVTPLFPGVVNLVSLSSPNASTKDLQLINLGLNMAPGSDTVQFLSKTGSLSSAGVYLWAGTDGFIDAVTESPAAVNVDAAEVLNVTVVSPTTWQTPAPYTP